MIDSTYFRPSEVDVLLGDSSKARDVLKWKPSVSFHELAKIMTDHDFHIAENEMRLGKKVEIQKKPII